MSDKAPPVPMNQLETAIWAAVYTRQLGTSYRLPDPENLQYFVELAIEAADKAVLVTRKIMGTGRHVPQEEE